MAVLRNYISTIHDIHEYWIQPVLSPRQDAGQKGYNPLCQGAAVNWSGVSLRARAFASAFPVGMRISLVIPFNENDVNFYNTTSPCVVLISPRHGLVCQHYRGTFDRGPSEEYTFLGKSGTRHTRKVTKATLNIGSDHTLLEFASPFPKDDVMIYDHIADVRYIPQGGTLWVHDCNGKAYKLVMRSAIYQQESVNGAIKFVDKTNGYIADGFLDVNNTGATYGNVPPTIWVGDSGSPTFVVDDAGRTIFIGLYSGGMHVNEAELAAINAQLQPMGYSAQHVKLSAKTEDVNGDGTVDGSDLSMILSAWGNGDAFKDTNGDGMVDAQDLAKVMSAWGAYEIARSSIPPANIIVDEVVNPVTKRK